MNTRNTAVISFLTCLIVLASSADAHGEAWPTYRHDNRRSGVTAEKLTLPLENRWEYCSTDVPRTAWAGPAKWDSYANLHRLKSMRNFDPVFYVTIANGCVYFGSSVDDAVHCLDVTTGQENWVFFTDGPVRIPPTCHDGKLYFGSDDGGVYCLTAETGDRLWRYRAVPDSPRIPINGKVTSVYPCRTGVLVQDDKVYFAASLLPWEKTYLCALDAESGTIDGTDLYTMEYDQMTAQGPMLASNTKLYVSQGRQAPLVFDRKNGRQIKNLGSSGFGGVFGLLTEDEMFIHGHGQNHRSDGELRFFDDQKSDLLVTYPRATSIIVADGIVYLHADGQLQAFHRDQYVALQGQIHHQQILQKTSQDKKKKLGDKASAEERATLDKDIQSAQERIDELRQSIPTCFLWRTASQCPLTLILAGQTLIAGGQGKIAAHDIKTGRRLWTAPVEGRAYGLAVSHGALLVSTDLGRIACFTVPTQTVATHQ